MREPPGKLYQKFAPRALEEHGERCSGTIPLPAESVDVVISNCVINLSADKGQVLREAYRLHAEHAGISPEAFEASLAESTLLGRLPRLTEVAAVAVLMASDRASAMTGAVANVTCGATVD